MRKEFNNNFESEKHDLKKRYKTSIGKKYEKRIKNILRSGHIDDILEYYDEDY